MIPTARFFATCQEVGIAEVGLPFRSAVIESRDFAEIPAESWPLSYSSPADLMSNTSRIFSYDLDRSIIWKTTPAEQWNYQFNSLDQLVKVDKGTLSGKIWTWTTQGEYWYDANGMMAKSVQAGVTTEYVYRGHDPLYEKSVTSSVQTDYVYVNGRVKAKIVTGGTSAGTYYYIQDALGSTRQVYKDGASTATFSVTTYKPFGIPAGIVTGTDRVRYAGELFDTSSGLYYVFARYMDPERVRATVGCCRGGESSRGGNHLSIVGL